MSKFDHSFASRSAKKWLREQRFPEDIDALLSQSNGSPVDTNLRLFLPGQVKRWDLAQGPIPVFLANDERAEEAVALIESVLDRKIFAIQSKSGVLGGRGIYVQIGTVGKNQDDSVDSDVGNVSSDPGGTDWETFVISQNGRFESVLWINLSAAPNVVPTFDQVVHEFGHALGLGDHFDGFGKPDRAPAVDYNFWAALVRLYQLPLGALYSELRPLA